MDKVSIRAPAGSDLGLAAQDLITLRTAPPLVFSLALVFFVTGSPIVSVISVGTTSYILSLWHRIAELKAPGG